MQTTGYFLRTLRNRCRTWLTRAAALVALCGFGIAEAQMVDMQGLDNVPSSAFLSGDNNKTSFMEKSQAASSVWENRILSGILMTGTGKGDVKFTMPQYWQQAVCWHNENLLCYMSLEVGTFVSVEAVPHNNNSFTGWRGGPCAGKATNPCDFLAISNEAYDYLYIAEFTENSNSSNKDLALYLAQRESLFKSTGLGAGTLTAVVDGQEYKCKKPPSEEINICRWSFSTASNITINAAPENGSVFGGWYYAPSSCNDSSGNCVFNLNENTPIIPIFHKKTSTSTYPLELSVLGAGSIYGPIPSQDGSFNPASEFLIGSENAGGSSTKILDYQSNGQVLLTPKPKEGWRFEHWNGACSGSGSCSVNMNAAQWVTATFTKESTEADVFYKLSAEWTGLGTIKITSNIDDALSCVAVNRDCSKFYKENTRVTLTATPEDGWEFSGWSGACTGMSDCTVTMNAAKSVVALFRNNDENGNNRNIIINFRKVGTGIGSILYARTDGLPAMCNHFSTFCSVAYTIDQRGSNYLSAQGEIGSIFTGWRTGPCAGSRELVCEIPVDVNAETIHIEAQFDRDPRLSSSCQARPFSDIEEKVQNAYIAFYGRPADVGGLDHWDKKLTAAGGDLNLIMDEFGNSEEYRDRFSNMDDRKLVNNLYMQLFARPSDDEGLDFYVDKVRQGTFTLASLAINLADGAKRGGDDWKVLEGRRKVARHYVTIMEATPGGNTELVLADYLASAHESNADAVCDALSKAVFP